MSYDIASVREKGASDQQIAEYLAKESGYDIGSVLKQGASYTQIAEYLASNSSAPAPKQSKERTWSEFGKDVALSAFQGLDTVAKLPAMAYDKATSGDWYGPETQKISAMSDEREKLKSEYSQRKSAEKQATAKATGEAAKEYVGGGPLGTAAQVAAEFGSSFWESLKDPASIPEFAAQQVAQLGVMGKAGRGAEIAAQAAAKSAPSLAATKLGQAAISNAGTAGAVAAGAGLQGVDVGSDTMQRLMSLPDEVWAQNTDYLALAERLGPEAAKQEIASQLAGEATLKAGGASLLTAALPGGSSIERAIVGKSKSGYAGIPKAFAGEAVQEGTEEGSGQYFANKAVGTINPNQPVWEGVGAAAGQGAFMGGVMGGGMHAGSSLLSPPTAVSDAQTVTNILDEANQAHGTAGMFEAFKQLNETPITIGAEHAPAQVPAPVGQVQNPDALGSTADSQLLGVAGGRDGNGVPAGLPGGTLEQGGAVGSTGLANDAINLDHSLLALENQANGTQAQETVAPAAGQQTTVPVPGSVNALPSSQQVAQETSAQSGTQTAPVPENLTLKGENHGLQKQGQETTQEVLKGGDQGLAGLSYTTNPAGNLIVTGDNAHALVRDITGTKGVYTKKDGAVTVGLSHVANVQQAIDAAKATPAQSVSQSPFRNETDAELRDAQIELGMAGLSRGANGTVVSKEAVLGRSGNGPRFDQGAVSLADRLGVLAGLNTRFYTSDDAGSPAAFVRSGSKNIFINADRGNEAVGALVGHEIGHTIKSESPDLYADYLSALGDAVGHPLNDAAGLLFYLPSYDSSVTNAEINKLKMKGVPTEEILNTVLAKVAANQKRSFTKDDLVEELVMDIFGNRFTEPEFWDKVGDKLAQKNPSLLKRLVNSLTKIIDAIKGDKGIKFKEADKFISDMEKARDAASQYLADHIHENGLSVQQLREGDGYASQSPKRDAALTDEGTTKPAKQKMMAVHNLSQDNLMFANKMGGLAVPSIGIVNEDAGAVDGFGDVTLIGKKDLADPGKVPVFSSDAYTSRFPKPEWPKAKTKDAQKLVDEIRPYSDEFGDRSILDYTWDGMVNKPDANEVVGRWLSSNAIRAMFLRGIGVEAQPVIDPIKLSSGLTVDQFESIRDLYLEVQAQENEGKYGTAQEEHLKETLQNMLEQNYVKAGVREVSAQKIIQRVIEKPTFYLYQDMRAIKDGPTVNSWETSSNLSKLTDARAVEFKKWVEEKVMPNFGDPFIKVNGKKAPYTLDNIVTVMTDAKVRGKEKTMTFGAGQARAASSVQFSDVEQMREAAKRSITNPEEYARAKELTEKKLDAYRSLVVEYTKLTDWRGKPDTWEALDASMRALAKFATSKARDASAMKKALQSEKFDAAKIPADDIYRAIDAAKSMLAAPVPYFEAKPQRAVGLNEFAGAVIPPNASQEVRDILSANGIPFKEHTGEGSRTEVVRSMADEVGAKFSPRRSTVEVDGVTRSAVNSNGKPIAQTEEGLRNFWRWFGDSKVVDAEGKPLVVYHGTNAHAYVGGQINVFNTNPGSGRGAAFFSSNSDIAAQYGEKQYATYLSVKNPLVVDADGAYWSVIKGVSKISGAATDAAKQASQKSADEMNALFAEMSDLLGGDATGVDAKIKKDATDLSGLQLKDLPGFSDGEFETDAVVKAAKKLGFDGVIFRNVQDSPTFDASYGKHLSDVYAAFSPTQIKSATGNNGQFDSGNPDIRYSPRRQDPLQEAINQSVDDEFTEIVARMKAAGVLEVDCS